MNFNLIFLQYKKNCKKLWALIFKRIHFESFSNETDLIWISISIKCKRVMFHWVLICSGPLCIRNYHSLQKWSSDFFFLSNEYKPRVNPSLQCINPQISLLITLNSFPLKKNQQNYFQSLSATKFTGFWLFTDILYNNERRASILIIFKYTDQCTCCFKKLS